MNLFQKKNVSFITEPQDDFFCFIPPSLEAKNEFKYIGIGLLWDLGGGGGTSTKSAFVSMGQSL